MYVLWVYLTYWKQYSLGLATPEFGLSLIFGKHVLNLYLTKTECFKFWLMSNL